MANKSNGSNKNQNNARKNQRSGRNDRAKSNQLTNMVNRRSACIDMGPVNDISWYATNPLLVRNAGNISYNVGLGSATDIGFDAAFSYNGTELNTVPGVMRAGYIPGPGYSDEAGSPVNVAADSIYSYVRHANSGHGNYDPSDLMMYYLAMDSAYGYAAWMRRILGTTGLYSQFNRYTPDVLLYAMDVNPLDIRNHINDLRGYLDIFIRRLAAYVIPSNMAYIARHMWLTSNIYLDEPSLKAQMIVPTPEGFYHYEEDSDTGGRCIWDSIDSIPTVPGTLLTFDDIVRYGDKLISCITGSEDLGIMSGDILKSYSEGGIFRMELVEPGYMVVPTYVAEVLDQLHNATFCTNEWSNLDIVQVAQDVPNSWYIKYKPTINIDGDTNLLPSYYMYEIARLLDVTVDDPDPNVTMIASRDVTFMERVTNDWDSANPHLAVSPTIMGSEFFTRVTVYRIQPGPNGGYSISTYDRTFALDSENPTPWNVLTTFNKSPMFFRYAKFGNTTTLMDYHADLNNWATITKKIAKNLHTVALLSLFDVPVMGLFSK